MAVGKCPGPTCMPEEVVMKLGIRGLAAFALTLLLGLAPPAIAQDHVLVVGQIAEPASLDPSVVTAVNDFRILVNVYD